MIIETGATVATGEGIETLQDGPARDKSDSYYARLLWLLKVLIESSTTAGQDLNALNNESLQFVNNYILEFVNFMQRTPCKYSSEGAAREWSTVVIVIVIFMT